MFSSLCWWFLLVCFFTSVFFSSGTLLTASVWTHRTNTLQSARSCLWNMIVYSSAYYTLCGCNPLLGLNICPSIHKGLNACLSLLSSVHTRWSNDKIILYMSVSPTSQKIKTSKTVVEQNSKHFQSHDVAVQLKTIKVFHVYTINEWWNKWCLWAGISCILIILITKNYCKDKRTKKCINSFFRST